MEPLEKAIEILKKYENIEHSVFADSQAKRAHKCAEIAIDEVIGQWEYVDVYLANGQGQLNQNLKYWYEVRECLNSLKTN